MNTQDKNMVLERYIRGKEEDIIDSYIAKGPTILKKELEVSDEEWEVIFDHLVFEKNLFYKCVARNTEFFMETYIKFGTAHVRDVLAISDSKYDKVWELVFDYVAIANEGLYLHVVEHRDRYMIAMKARGTDFVRKVLGTWNKKYNESWAKVLNFLLHAACDAIFSETTFERGLKAFSEMMNKSREHRVICEEGIL